MIKLNTKYLILNTNKGQLLIETMVGLSIAMVGLLGVVTLISNSASLNRVVSDQFIGTYLASEGIEIVKNIIDTNLMNERVWNSGLSNSGTFDVDYSSSDLSTDHIDETLKYDSATGLYSYEIGDPTSFTRKIEIIPIGDNEIKVNSIVSWSSRGGAQFSVNLEDHFFNLPQSQ